MLQYVTAIVSCGLLFASIGHAAESVDIQGPLTIQSQGSFFVGGTSRYAEALSVVDTGLDVTRAGATMTGQMYVQYQLPVAPKHLPIVMIHGGALSGQAWDTTPDGRMGWSEYFLRAGRPVYVIDQAGRGRSGFDATRYNAVKLGTIPAKDQAPIQIIGAEFAWTWFRIGPKFGVAYPDTQFPVDAVDAFYKMWIPDLNAALPPNNPTYSDLAVLGKKVGGAVLVGHSESFMFPERAALVDPTAVKGIISLESSASCAISFTDQELTTLAKIPMLIVFADHQADAPGEFGPRWMTGMGQCRDLAASIQKVGGDVTFLHLPEMGIHGNTHMFMIDKNNLQIADILLAWINTHVEHAAQ